MKFTSHQKQPKSWAGRMLSAILSALVLLSLVSTAYADNFGYNSEEVAYAWYDTSGGTTVTLSDDQAINVDLGFLFTFYGNSNSFAQISSNGYLRMGSGSATQYSNRNMPNTGEPNNIIAPFWDDLDPRNGGTIRYSLQGVDGSRRFVVEWDNLPFFGNSSQRASFQAVLFEGSNYIMFNIKSTGRQCNGCTHTIGIENASGNDGTQIDFSANAINRRSWVIRGPIRNVNRPSCGNDGTYFCTNLEYGFDSLLDEPGFTTLWQGPRPYSRTGCDDSRIPIPMPFQYQFYNTNYPAGQTVYVSSNGMLSFHDQDHTGYISTTIPSPALADQFFAPGWTDLLPCTAGRVVWKVRGTSPNRRLVIEWNGVPNYFDISKQTTIQLVMHEGSQVIDYHVARIEAPPSIPYSIGVENHTGTVGVQIARGDGRITTRSYRLTRQASLCSAASLGNACTYTAGNDPIPNQSSCRTGITACVNGAVTCTRQNFPLNEVCDNADNDCDGRIDDGVGTVWYRDADNDQYGTNQVALACTQPRGYTNRAGDCNDRDRAVNPGAREVCDYVDNNCNNQTDEGLQTVHYWDADRDSFGGPAPTANQCPGNVQDSRWVTRAGDCQPNNQAINPDATEICDGIDNNCIDGIDENLLTRWYRDFDRDNFGNPGNSTEACNQPRGYVADNRDCNDANRNINPDAAESCNNIDDNCNNQTDEGNPGGGQQCSSDVPGACSDDAVTECVDGDIVCQVEDVAGFGTVEEFAVPQGLVGRNTGLVDAASKLITSNGEYLFNLAYSVNSGGYNGWTVRVFKTRGGLTLLKEFRIGAVSFYTDGISAKGDILYAVQWSGSNGAVVQEINWRTETLVRRTSLSQGNTQAIEGQYDWVNDVFWMGALRFGANIYEHSSNEISQASLVRTISVDPAYGHSGAGTVASDGRFLYVKKWGSSYPGSTDLVRIGSGYGGTARGKYYGTVATVRGTLSTTYHADGYVYIGSSNANSLQRVKVSAPQFEVCDGIDNNCNDQVDEGFNVRASCDGPSGQCDAAPGTIECTADGQAECSALSNFSEVDGYGDVEWEDIPGGLVGRNTGFVDTNWKLVTSNGRYIFNLAYSIRSGGYNGWTVRVFDPVLGFRLIKEFTIATSSFYTDGISAKGDILYAIQWSNRNGAIVQEINWRTESLIRRTSLDQGDTAAIEGQYDWVNDVFWMGELQDGARIYEHDGSGLDTNTRIDIFNPQDYSFNGAGTVASDGQFLYIKRWGNYPGSTSLVRIGSGYGGTVRGKNYGTVASVATTLSSTFHPNGYVYIGSSRPNQIQRVRVTAPLVELCDGIDNDCDDEVDEDYTNLGTECSEGVGACEDVGQYVCNAAQNGTMCTAVPGAPRPEICDNVDNNCDGQIDENLRRACDTVCGIGSEICLAGGWEGCNAPQPTAEICDGSDNDCNGFIDDSDECGCQFFPQIGDITPALEWMWSSSSTNVQTNFTDVMMTPVVGHLTDDNGDGNIDQNDIAEVAFVTTARDYRRGGYLRVVNGEDGSERWVYTARRVSGASSPAIGDLDNDGTPEVVAYAWRDAAQGGPTTAGLLALDNQGNELWNNTAVNRYNGAQLGSPAIANIDPNSPGNEIAACHWLVSSTGATLWDRMPTRVSTRCAPAVADVDGDGLMEIVIGARAYNHDGSILWDNTTVYNQLGRYYGALPAIADFNRDGVPEVVVVRARIMVLDGATGVMLASMPLAGGGNGGPPNIDDFDGDGIPEIGVAGASSYDVYEFTRNGNSGTLSVLWSRATQDFSSNITGSSVFDFNGDGNAEVVYNDETHLRIYDGRNGNILFEEANGSGTLVEYPVIVDVDNDGNAEIIVGRNNVGNFSSNGGLSPTTGLLVFGDSSDNWVNTRSFWNQFSYHVTNINDDTTIPTNEPNSWGAGQPNSYRSNSPGAVGAFAAPDLLAGSGPQSVDPPQVLLGSAAGQWVINNGDPGVPICPAYVTVVANVCNDGDVDVLPGLSAGVYIGDPRNGGELGGSVVTTERLAPGECQEVVINFPNRTNRDGPQEIWLWVDDNENENECDEENNISLLGTFELESATDEICDNVDNDCDGEIDNFTRLCPEQCGGREQICLEGDWSPCEAPELCNGIDEDCDGQINEEVTDCSPGQICGCITGGGPNGLDCSCVEGLEVGSCGAGCPLGTVCDIDNQECVPYCVDDSACPSGMTCADNNCEVAPEEHTSLDEAWQEGQKDGQDAQAASCSASLSSSSGALGGFGLFLGLALGVVGIRRSRRP